MSEVTEKIINITDVRYIDGYRLRIVFNDGTRKTINFEQFLKNAKHPDIQKYIDLAEFKNYSIIDGNLDWNDFELCFPNHELYQGIV